MECMKRAYIILYVHFRTWDFIRNVDDKNRLHAYCIWICQIRVFAWLKFDFSGASHNLAKRCVFVEVYVLYYIFRCKYLLFEQSDANYLFRHLGTQRGPNLPPEAVKAFQDPSPQKDLLLRIKLIAFAIRVNRETFVSATQRCGF